MYGMIDDYNFLKREGEYFIKTDEGYKITFHISSGKVTEYYEDGWIEERERKIDLCPLKGIAVLTPYFEEINITPFTLIKPFGPVEFNSVYLFTFRPLLPEKVYLFGAPDTDKKMMNRVVPGLYHEEIVNQPYPKVEIRMEKECLEE